MIYWLGHHNKVFIVWQKAETDNIPSRRKTDVFMKQLPWKQPFHKSNIIIHAA